MACTQLTAECEAHSLDSFNQNLISINLAKKKLSNINRCEDCYKYRRYHFCRPGVSLQLLHSQLH